ncbi:hypothetical protein [Halomonas caseinilytica]|uniref:hypothetical protein n=1 Tax=Halomonas caseinilytica TaxID=438744 RepID=UPI0007E53D84|nr:hypothetical protein [Halomonas caseinilytica]SEN66259.1 hypothetical protein SAMN04487952_12340 [Halomonas caseinilytica]
MPLTRQEAEDLLDQLYATAEVLGNEIKPAAASLMIRDLRDYDRPEIEQALARCRSEITGRLTLAAILERMPSANAFLSPNEAWALALASMDEAETVVWTEEIAQALGVASPILAEGDKVGARMAFLSAYERAVDQAKAVGRRPEWKPSLGHDPQRRETVLQEAVEDGKLPAPRAEALLPPPDKPTTEVGRAQVRQITDHLRDIIAGRDQAAARRREDRRQQEEERRQELIAQAEQRMAERDNAIQGRA